MLRVLKHLVAIVLFVAFAGCAGGGCSSGCSCAGITPLPEGFPTEKRIENAGSIRLTDSGLDFLESNIGTLAGSLLGDGGGGTAPLTFDIPTVTQNIVIADLKICPGGPNPTASPPECVAEIDLENAQLTITPGADHNIVVSGPVPIRIQKIPVVVDWLIGGDSNMSITLNNGKSCSDPTNFQNVDLTIDLSIEIDADTGHSRFGYSMVRVPTLSMNSDDLNDALEYCGTELISNGLASILDALDNLFFDTLVDSLIGDLGKELESGLCQQANPALNPPCPNGTTDVNGICRYGTTEDDECASIILGLDGKVDVGALLASLSPGTTGSFDFLFAAGGHTVRNDGSPHFWGDLNPINDGATLGMYGGAEPGAISGCVPLANLQLPTDIPMPDEVLANTVPDWPTDVPGPHFGFALSERYVNYLLGQIYNSGALCLGLGSDALGDAIPLTTGLLAVGLGTPSMNELGLQKASSAVALTVRPSTPPTVTFGNGTNIKTDPLILLEMDKVSIDFYVWSLGRYVRTITITMDITVPVNLNVTPNGLEPAVEELGIDNVVTTTTPLIREDPQQIGEALQGLLGSLVGSLLGDALPAVDINEQLASLGLTLDIPPTVEGSGSPGLRKLTKGSDAFLGIFAGLGLASAPASNMQSNTSAELVDFEIDPYGLRLQTFTRDNGPVATLRLGSDLDDGTRAVEWQYKVDSGPWHPFRSERNLVIKDDWLRAQGRHYIYVRSRIVGDVMSLDPEPVKLELIVDDQEPRITLRDENDFSTIQIDDAVSGAKRTMARVRLGHRVDDEMRWSPWSEWQAADTLHEVPTTDADYLEVEARDEQGNVATVSHELIRGSGAADAAGCECSVVTPRREHPLGWWLLIALGIVPVWRRRAKRPRPSLSSHATRKRPRQFGKMMTFLLFCGLWAGCSCSDDTAVQAATGCRARGDCLVIEPGLIGAYTSATVGKDGALWVAGYLEANWPETLSYGDLVVGKYDGERVNWQTVDGVPDEPEVNEEEYDPTGFRGGQTEPGDDVGLWTSIAVDDSGNPAVAYYDVTNRALRYASLHGGSWSVSVVQDSEQSDIGAYAKLLFINNQPVISYQFLEAIDNGSVNSGVRVARGNSPDAGKTTWSFEDVVSVPNTPCRSYLCASGQKCLSTAGVCAEVVTNCPTECNDGEKCVSVGGESRCEGVVATNQVDSYQPASGLYVSSAAQPDGSIGIAYYDRLKGNLMLARKDGEGYQNVIVDGESGGENTGDVGIAASLDIDSGGDFHIAYVDGITEALKYVSVVGGTTVGAVEVVDDGFTVDQQVHSDGLHIVGDDAHLVVTPAGDIHISYQDASAGHLRFAVGTKSGSAHDWSLKSYAQADTFGGFFSRQAQYDGQKAIVHFWRSASPYANGDVSIIQP